MSSEFVVYEVHTSFENFCVETPPEKLGESRGHTCLMDYIRAWIHSGEGIRTCAGDYQTYLLTVIAIIEQWTREPSVLRYLTDEEEPEAIERRVSSIFGDDGPRHIALDEHWFAKCAFWYLHPRESS